MAELNVESIPLHLEIENLRALEMRRIYSNIKERLRSFDGKITYSRNVERLVTRYFMSNLGHPRTGSFGPSGLDMIIPKDGDLSSVIDDLKNVLKAKRPEHVARDLNLNEMCKDAISSIYKLKERLREGDVFGIVTMIYNSNSRRYDLFVTDDERDMAPIKETFRVSYPYSVYQEMRSRFQGLNGDMRLLPFYLYAILGRYTSLSIDTFGLAVPTNVLYSMRRLLNINFELFASAINAKLDNFCSIFPDIEGPFGSKGSFFDYEPLPGNYEANPPFMNDIMERTSNRIVEVMKRLEERGEEFMVVLVYPDWPVENEYGVFEGLRVLMNHKKYLVRSYPLKDKSYEQRETGNRIKVSGTIIHILQNEPSKRGYPLDIIESKMEEIMSKW